MDNISSIRTISVFRIYKSELKETNKELFVRGAKGEIKNNRKFYSLQDFYRFD